MNNVASSPSVPSASPPVADRVLLYLIIIRVMKAPACKWIGMQLEMLTTTALCKLLRYLTLLEYLPIDVYYAYKDMVAGKGPLKFGT
jgi:hypothetical protein